MTYVFYNDKTKVVAHTAITDETAKVFALDNPTFIVECYYKEELKDTCIASDIFNPKNQ